MITTQKRTTRFLLLSASLRRDSLNSKLIRLAAGIIRENGDEAQIADMAEFDCPSFNQDLEPDGSHPAGAEAFRKKLLETDALIIAAPEFNASMPGNLKNIIDWVSRYRPQPFNERHTLLLSASPSMVGGNRGLWSLRIPLEHLGARVYPDMFSLAMAHQAFTPEGEIANETLAARFATNIKAFMAQVEATLNYPCIKKAWVEFLGEKPDPVTERVE